MSQRNNAQPEEEKRKRNKGCIVGLVISLVVFAAIVWGAWAWWHRPIEEVATQGLYNALGGDMEKLQFYVSSELNLARSDRQNSVSVQGGTVQRKQDDLSDRIHISAGTRGKLLGTGISEDGRFWCRVGFEQGYPDRYLSFTQKLKEAGKPDGLLWLSSDAQVTHKEKRSKWFSSDIEVDVLDYEAFRYGGVEYIGFWGEHRPTLIVKGLDKKNKKQEYRKVEGWTVDDEAKPQTATGDEVKSQPATGDETQPQPTASDKAKPQPAAPVSPKP